jgi:tRNA-dihydrouridine synthase B
MYIEKLKIGNVELENNILLAPMAGVTDLSYRKICKKYGNPGLVCTEMISSKGLFYNDKKTEQFLVLNEEKRPIAIQIFGSDPSVMGQAAKIVEQYADIIDINMGCPAPKVVKNGDGSKLLLNLELVGNIVKEVVQNTTKPVTVKIRKGWDDEHIVAVEAAKVIEKAGASAITVHGRTREQYYSGQVDLEIIKKAKEAVKIPVIGNGDVKTTEDARKMFEYTGVDGIMIGRGILGEPWKINDIIQELTTGQKPQEKTPMEKLKIIKEHIELEMIEKGEYVGVREMRKHICWYLKNLPNSSQVRQTINMLESKDEVIETLEQYFRDL